MIDIHLDTSEVGPGLLRWRERVLPRILFAAGTLARDMEAYAKANRPWTDRTGQARQRLHGYVRHQGAEARIGIGHGVSYGVFLELKQAGRYAILRPTLHHLAPTLPGRIRAALRGV